MLGLLQATPFHHLIFETAAPDVAGAAQRAGFAVIEPQRLPPDVRLVKGLWPGIRLSHSGGDRAVAGPTGEPWVDSNGWRVRAVRARGSEGPIWVDAKPQVSRSSAEDYVIAFADAAAHNARWLVALDDTFAAEVAARKFPAMERWKQIVDAAAYFGTAEASPQFRERAVVGVLSEFGGPRVGFTDEVLNNLARTKQQYRAIPVGHVTAESFAGLKGLVYTDAVEPPSTVRKMVLDFVGEGGMLITGPGWGSLPNGNAQRSHPRFAIRTLGAGSIASATTNFADPYLAANDAVVLISHRHDLVRFFNSGAITPCLAVSADGRRATLRTVFYSLRPVEDTSVWIRGAYRSAMVQTWPQRQQQKVRLEVRDAGVEVYLPAVSQYAVIELES